MKLRLAWLGLLLVGKAAQAEPEYRTEYKTTVRADRDLQEAATVTLGREEARRLPGAADDALRAVESAAGVARAALGSGQLVVWGAAPQDSRVLIDGVEVPSLYHLGGLRTILPTALVKEVSLSPGGFGAEHGRALGGLVAVATALPSEAGFHGSLSVDALDAGATLSASLGRRVKVQLAGRYSYIDRLLTALAGDKVGDAFALPRYDDYQAQLQLALRPGESLTATFLAADDALRRARATADAPPQSESWTRTFYRLSLRYQRRLSDGTAIRMTPFFGYDRDSYIADFGGTPSRLAKTAYRYGLRASYQAAPRPWLLLTAGLDWQGTVSALGRFGSLSRPGREGDIAVFGQPPGSEVSADDWGTHAAELAPFLAATLRLGPLTVEPGLRLGGHLLESGRLTPRLGATPAIGLRQLLFTVEPRLLLRYRPQRRVGLFAAAGLYHQPPQPEDLSASFGNPRLGLSQAAHAVAGLDVELPASVRVEVAGFYRYFGELPARSALATPPLAAVLTGDGRGYAYGGQLVVRLGGWRGLSGWVAYTLGRSLRQDAAGAPVRLFDQDQTHILVALAGYRTRGWELGLRLRYSSGFPRTPVVDAYYDAGSDRFAPIFGVQNSTRLPDFVQLDARLARDVRFWRLALTVYLEVQNVTYQRNAEEIVYRYDFTQPDYITGLPPLAILGARLSW